MERMTSAFPSSTPSHDSVNLDNMIFYSGPATAKTREITPSDTDDWSDIDMIFTGAAPQEWAAATSAQTVDPADRFGTTGEDVQSAIDTGLATQASVSTLAHFEDVGTPLYDHSDDLCNGAVDAGVSMKPQESLDIWAVQMKRVPAGTSDAVPLDVQHNEGNVRIAVQDSPLDNGASFALWAALRGDGSTCAMATDGQISPPRTSETYEPNLPLHTRGFSPGDPDIDMAPSDKSPFEEMDPTVLESSSIRRQNASRTAFGISAITHSSGAPMSDRAHSSRSAATTDAADTEGSEGDEPPLTRRRQRRTRLCTRGSVSPSPHLTPQSSVHSVEVKPTIATHRRKRLRKRKGARPDPPTRKTDDDTSTSLTTFMSSSEGGERWPVQCFVE